jgi:hypothetical protein
MHSYPMRTIEDAFSLVRRYGLDRADFAGGSAEGFAAWLFIPGHELYDVSVIAQEVEKYKWDFVQHEKSGQNLDERLIAEAAERTETLKSHAQSRRELAEFIRSVKFGVDGGHLWAAVAELATTPARARLMPGDSKTKLLPRLNAVIRGLREFEKTFGDSRAIGYTPGCNGQLDLMLRMDIERFDVTLVEAAPWDGKESDWSFEMSALLRLAASDLVAVETRQAGVMLN